ncbi:MAG: MBL fold metallo-hydrolase [Gammaproteobacteria bacterium]|nr:MAG: MBL fold metallo-hydrolase [Gammaproteobacteria bacterium]
MGLLAACSSNPYYDPQKPHHTPSGFRNLHYEDSNKGLWTFLQWRWEKLFKDIPGVEDYDFTLAANDPQLLQQNQHKTSLTWIGHATFLIQYAGLNILTDPQFSQRASPVSWAGPQRVVAPGLALTDLPEIDAVVISHDHYDSLDVATIRQLAARKQQRPLTFLVPLGMKPWFDNLGIASLNVIELDWQQSHHIGEIRFTATPVQHWGKRTLFDGYERLWCSWVIADDQHRLFFAGDTGYADHFRDIGNQYGPFDLALIPIGAYEPRWFMRPYHVNPEEAVMMHRDLRAQYSVAMHWGTFILTDEPLDEPPRKLAEALQKFNLPPSTFEVYQHGETRFLDFDNDK